MHCTVFACTSLLFVLLAARIVTSSSLNQAGRKELLSVSPPVTIISNSKHGENPPVTNLPLWNKRAKIKTIVGYMTVPTAQAPSKLVTYAERARELAKAGNSSSIKPENIYECNVGFPVSKLRPGDEDSGTLSGVVSLRVWTGSSWAASCSGTLLNSKLVATAAHCVYDTERNQWTVSKDRPRLVVASLNGRNDRNYRTVYATTAVIYSSYANKKGYAESLYDNSDVAVLKLQSALSGKTYTWTSPFPSLTPRHNFGYPAERQDGFTIFFDRSDSAQATGCGGKSKDLLCENVSLEGGMSGGPIMHYQSAIQIGVASGRTVGGCPGFYAGLTGTFSLKGLVSYAGCRTSSKSSGGRTVHSASC